jgi:histone deacetylase 1/2
MDDESYRYVFEPIMQKVMESYQPGAVVVCGGADSLSGDRLGCFNLSLQGHAACMDFLARFGVPLLVLGGGGYTMRNVARCWCYETGRLLGLELDDELPGAALAEYDYYMDTHRLRIAVSNMRNANTRDALESIKLKVLANLAALPPAPSAPIGEAPPGLVLPDAPEPDADVRGGGQAADDARVAKADDGYGSDGEAGARHVSAEEMTSRNCSVVIAERA